MKKEYLILILIIVGLSAYLVTHKEGGSNYELPIFSSVNVAEVTALELSSKDGVLKLIKDDDSWVVGEMRYPADKKKIDPMLKTVGDFELTALVSEQQNLARYELDPEHKIEVVAKQGDEIVRTFVVGKGAPTYNHTFVTVSGEEGVFHARGSFRNDFDQSLDALREKQVLSLNLDKVGTILVEKGDIALELTRDVGAADKEGEKKSKKEEGRQKAVSWQAQDGTSPDTDFLNSLLSIMDGLDCAEFTKGDDKADYDGKNPLIRITVNDGESAVLSIFAKGGGENYPCITSRNPYPFFLDSYQAENIIKKVDKLLGIEAPKEPAPPKESAVREQEQE